MKALKSLTVAAVLAIAVPMGVVAQQPPPPYGAPLSLDAAKKAMAGAEAEAKKNNWAVVIAIIDTTGSLVMLQKLDNTSTSAVELAISKAKTALDFRRPTKALQEAVAGGGAALRLLSIRSATLIDGGVPIVADGKLVGAIGVSGALADQDGQVATAGSTATK